MTASQTNKLFSKGGLWQVLEDQLKRADALLAGITAEQLRSTGAEQLIQDIVRDLSIEPLLIFEDRMQTERTDTEIDMTGFDDYHNVRTGSEVCPEVRFVIPFSGDPVLWQLKPEPGYCLTPEGEIDPEKSLLILTDASTSRVPDFEPARLHKLQLIRDFIRAQTDLLAQYHRDLANKANKGLAALQ